MARDIDIRLDMDEGQLTATATSEAGALVIRATTKVLNRAKILCPVRTGRLRASLQMKISRTAEGYSGEVTTNVQYASYVHDGTLPHLIYPRRPGGFLRFPVPAGSHNFVFARVVHHPGTRARPFLRLALEEVAPQMGFAS